MKTCKKCNAKFPFNLEIDGKIRNLCKRQYCLDCSPFGKHNTANLTKSVSLEKQCGKCQKTKSISDFYKKSDRKNVSSYCKQCTTQLNIDRLRIFKQTCVVYKGGKCERCGYDRYIGALDFHHIKPSEKDFCIAHRGNTKFDERIRKELDKCSLLCSNCHREIHNDI
jgi:hypothetical protein